MEDTPTRRRLVTGSGAVLSAAVAGCLAPGSGGAPGDTPSDTPSRTPTATPTSDGSPTPTPRSGTVSVDVAPGGALVFEPATAAPVRVTPGTTVRFDWRTGGHNIVVLNQPGDADWSGTAGGPARTYDEGHVHEHTFTVPGAYTFQCDPHAPSMRGEIRVVEG
jgi:plastocyanin